AQEVAVVSEQCASLLKDSAVEMNVPRDVMEVLVGAFQELRDGMTSDGVPIDKPTTILSTAEAVSVALQAALDAWYYGSGNLTAQHLGRHLLGTAIKDNPDDVRKLKQYFDVVIRQRAESDGGAWADFFKARKEF